MRKYKATIDKFSFYAKSTLISFAILYCCLYCGRLNLILSFTTIAAETTLTAVNLGMLSSVMLTGYAAGQMVNGRLSEIIGSRKIIISGVLASVALNLIISFQNSILVMGILFFLNGYSQSMVFAPGLNQLSKWWTADRHGFTSGIVIGSSAVAQVVAWAAVFVSFKIAPEMGWRAAFRLPQILMLISLIVYFLFAKESPSAVNLNDYMHKNSEDDRYEEELHRLVEEKGKFYPYIYILRQWKFLIWLAIIFITYICRYGLITWIPKYYVEVFNTNISEGIMGTVFLPLGMAIGCFTIPLITDKLCPKNRMPAVIIASAFTAVSVIAFRRLDPDTGADILLFLVGFFVYSIGGVGMAYATDIGGRVFSGTASGVLDCAANLGGALQAIIFGFMLTKNGGWNNVFLIIIFGCVLICILSVIVSVRMNKDLRMKS